MRLGAPALVHAQSSRANCHIFMQFSPRQHSEGARVLRTPVCDATLERAVATLSC